MPPISHSSSSSSSSSYSSSPSSLPQTLRGRKLARVHEFRTKAHQQSVSQKTTIELHANNRRGVVTFVIVLIFVFVVVIVVVFVFVVVIVVDAIIIIIIIRPSVRQKNNQT